MTILSTWSSDRAEPPVGYGLDGERIDRFAGCCGPHGEPWALLFTPREVDHARSLDAPAHGLCASFCAKEALIKALGAAIDYRDCELLLRPGEEVHDLQLSPSLCEEHGVSGAEARVLGGGSPAECVVVVRLHSCGRPAT